MVKKIYPIHEEELLVIIYRLKKWRSDLLGSIVYVYTDHMTLINFDSQKNLLQYQLWWQEYIFGIYLNLSMIYIW